MTPVVRREATLLRDLGRSLFAAKSDLDVAAALLEAACAVSPHGGAVYVERRGALQRAVATGTGLALPQDGAEAERAGYTGHRVGSCLLVHETLDPPQEALLDDAAALAGAALGDVAAKTALRMRSRSLAARAATAERRQSWTILHARAHEHLTADAPLADRFARVARDAATELRSLCGIYRVRGGEVEPIARAAYSAEAEERLAEAVRPIWHEFLARLRARADADPLLLGEDMEVEEPLRGAILASGVRSALLVPHRVDDEQRLVFTLGSFERGFFTETDRHEAMLYVERVAAALRHAELATRTREMLVATVRTLAAAVDAKDPNTADHSANVAFLAVKLAAEMGLPEATRERVRLAALLHDIGKLAVPDAILRKAGPLERDERLVMMTHPVAGATILERAEFLHDLVATVRHHHEFFDGRGYPDGLAGALIPLEAQVLAVADAFDAIVSPRGYKPARATRPALEEIVRNRGTQFAPPAVDALARVIDRDLRADAPYLRAIDDRARGVPPGPLQRPLALFENAASTREVKAAFRIAGAFRVVDDPTAMLREVVDGIRDALPCDQASVLIRDEASGDLAAIAVSGGGRFPVIPRGRGIVGWVAEHAQPVLAADVARDEHYLDLRASTRSEICVPLRLNGKVIGVLKVESDRAGAFGVAELAMLEQVQQQVAVAAALAHRVGGG